jgi:hypothetical protein
MSSRQFLKENGDAECERCEAAANDPAEASKSLEAIAGRYALCPVSTSSIAHDLLVRGAATHHRS